ncbi:site-specific integrase [Oceanobacter sp. 5_MG-2023]|uniref:tyrosine-type recombinase/integrase n=1 Tax=Oceanobacter sp. 5_MG-2023 TaxID=3062645 RepID=UPI0026E27D24|nr:site-specific integrase [Oceanobacter sp. 5_MG-2023]MDO6681141.1 site-specific integrase [Oceanobacter sp. 5_MG-2023]
MSTASPIAFIDNLNYLSSPLTDARQVLLRQPSLREIEGSFDDLVHSFEFLVSFNGSTATFNSYRREIERLLQWTFTVRQCALGELRRADLEDYIGFCQSPPDCWIGTSQVARFSKTPEGRIPNSKWRPFVIQPDKSSLAGARPDVFALSQKSLQSVFAVLSSYFNYLIQEDYLQTNPVALIRQKSKYLQRHAYAEPIRRISNLQWDYIRETVTQLADDNPREHERSLFIMLCLFGMYLRISELVADERSTPVMGDFQCDQDGNWWLRVVGKGNKARMVTVSDDMLAALVRYREHLGLTRLPLPGEQTALIPKLKGRGPVTSTRQIRYLVQFCFDTALERMTQEGLADEAQELRVATVHWLRHTGISEDVRTRPKEHVKEDAGHASMATTDRYINTQMRERHASARNKKLKPGY